MEMTINEAISAIEMGQIQLEISQQPRSISLDMAISIMRKYQKIYQILDNWENSGEEDDPINIIDNIEEVLEDGKVD